MIEPLLSFATVYLFTIEANERIQRFPDNKRTSVQVLIWQGYLRLAPLQRLPRIPKCATNSSPNINCENRIPVHKLINRNPMTGTKQLLGHFYRLLDLLWQMISRGRPTPTNSKGEKPVVGTITCTGIAKRSSSTARSSSKTFAANVLVDVLSGAKLAHDLFVHPSAHVKW
jgi:hypothetical protein